MIHDCWKKLRKSLGTSFAKVVDQSLGDGHGGSIQKAVFILRIVREIGDRIPRLKLQDRSTPLASPFPGKTLLALHTLLAVHIVSPTLKAYNSSLSVAVKTRTNSHILWEGNPPLPIQPSPSAFRFLRELNKSMATLGGDLWAPACVRVLKGRVAEDVEKVIEEHMDVIKTNIKTESKVEEDKEETEEADDAVNSDAKESPPHPPSSNHEVHDRRLKQLLFDAMYIQRFVATDDSEKDGLIGVAQKREVSGLDEAALARLSKNAADYAKKTYLLFALLA
jgi:hypothetical protein